MNVYRIQDYQGRGPFNPGFSNKWVDENKAYQPDAPISELLKIKRIADKGLILAFACKSIDDLRKWISRSEYSKLKRMGYFAYSIDVDTIWELDNQIICGRKRPYRKGCHVIELYPQ
jgi:hypothetical protein